MTIARATLERVAVTGGLEDDADLSEGLWVGGGIFYRVGTNLNLGIAARASLMRSYRVFGVDHGGNSTHIGFVIGWGAERSSEK